MSFNMETTNESRKRTFNDINKEHNDHMKVFNVKLEEINYIDDEDTESDYILLNNEFKKQKITTTKHVTFKL